MFLGRIICCAMDEKFGFYSLFGRCDKMYHEVGQEITVRNFETQSTLGCLLLSSSNHDAIAAVPLEEVTLQLNFRPQVQLTQSLILYHGFAAVRNLCIQLFETRILTVVHAEIVHVNA
jgi:hypothetical protein